MNINPHLLSVGLPAGRQVQVPLQVFLKGHFFYGVSFLFKQMLFQVRVLLL